MEEKKESQRIRMLELLTNEENNLMLYDALHDKDLTKFFYLLKQGYALTPFLLNCMIDYGYEKHIEKALCVCDRCSFAIYDAFTGVLIRRRIFLLKTAIPKLFKSVFQRNRWLNISFGSFWPSGGNMPFLPSKARLSF